MADRRNDPILTLEPLIDAVRLGIEASGWELSGLQKTTSHRFEGRWAGDSTRSAYLFFHRPDRSDAVALEAYLDETSRGLTGNLAMVVDLRPLAALGDVPRVVRTLGDLSLGVLPDGYRTPLTLRLRLDRGQEAESASSEVRFKLHLTEAALEAGQETVGALAVATVRAFEALLTDRRLARLLEER
jgi:hypothetical protein